MIVDGFGVVSLVSPMRDSAVDHSSPSRGSCIVRVGDGAVAPVGRPPRRRSPLVEGPLPGRSPRLSDLGPCATGGARFGDGVELLLGEIVEQLPERLEPSEGRVRFACCRAIHAVEPISRASQEWDAWLGGVVLLPADGMCGRSHTSIVHLSCTPRTSSVYEVLRGARATLSSRLQRGVEYRCGGFPRDDHSGSGPSSTSRPSLSMAPMALRTVPVLAPEMFTRSWTESGLPALRASRTTSSMLTRCLLTAAVGSLWSNWNPASARS